jgi:hypothetical protein
MNQTSSSDQKTNVFGGIHRGDKNAYKSHQPMSVMKSRESIIQKNKRAMSQRKLHLYSILPCLCADSSRAGVIRQKNNVLHQTYLGNGPTANVLPKSISKRQQYYVNTSDNIGSVFSNESVMNQISHGTSPKQIAKAFRSYLNMTGAGDYDLPSLIGSTIRDSVKKNSPVYTFKGSDRTKLSWYPSRHVEFQGRDAPPLTNYSPDV